MEPLKWSLPSNSSAFDLSQTLQKINQNYQNGTSQTSFQEFPRRGVLHVWQVCSLLAHLDFRTLELPCLGFGKKWCWYADGLKNEHFCKHSRFGFGENWTLPYCILGLQPANIAKTLIEGTGPKKKKKGCQRRPGNCSCQENRAKTAQCQAN